MLPYFRLGQATTPAVTLIARKFLEGRFSTEGAARQVLEQALRSQADEDPPSCTSSDQSEECLWNVTCSTGPPGSNEIANVLEDATGQPMRSNVKTILREDGLIQETFLTDFEPEVEISEATAIAMALRRTGKSDAKGSSPLLLTESHELFIDDSKCVMARCLETEKTQWLTRVEGDAIHLRISYSGHPSAVKRIWLQSASGIFQSGKAVFHGKKKPVTPSGVEPSVSPKLSPETSRRQSAESSRLSSLAVQTEARRPR